MSAEARRLAIATLAEAFNVRDMTPARVRIYDKALEAVPVPVLEPMVQRAIASRQWFPKVAELLEDAEAYRVQLLAAQRFEVCPMNEGCSAQGWTARDVDGVTRMVRCGCWLRLQATIAALGVGQEPLALQAAREPQEGA